MIRILSVIISLFFYVGCSGKVTDSVVLVRNGQPIATIIIADEPSEAAQLGAKVLQEWISKATSAVVPIITESQTPKDEKKQVILVGNTKRTQSLGIDPEKFDLEEVVIRTFPETLVIVGDDERPDGVKLKGTLLAVDMFAEEFLGIRVLWPGELGEIVPERRTIEVSNININHKPLLCFRRIRNVGIILPSVREKLETLGLNCDEYPAFHTGARTWFRFHHLYGSFMGALPHAFTQYWKRFHMEHPEWFALQPDGTRNNGRMDERYRLNFEVGALAQLCVSNQELVEQVARDCIETFKKNPTLDVFSISPNDDGTGTPSFCLCEKCEAMDAPDGKIITISTLDGRMEHVSLTDRFIKFFSSVAEIVEKEMPDRYLGALAYSSYTLPPVHSKLHPNVIIGLVPGGGIYLHDGAREKMLDNWLKWSEAASRLFLRPNLLMALKNFPSIYVHRLGEDMRFFADHKLTFTDFDCCFHHWSTNSLNYYVLAKLLWDPYRNVNEIIDDYCRAGFGPASNAVRSYFEKLENITTDIAGERKGITPELIAKYYNDDVLSGLHALLVEADRLADSDELIKKRIDFLRAGLEYVPISRNYIIAKSKSEKGNKDTEKELADAAEKRDAWFRKQGFSWVLSIPWTLAYDH